MLPSASPYVTFNTSTVAFASGTRYRFRTRAYDGTAYSSWKDCDGSFGTPGGGDGGSTGGGTGKTGCSCSTGPDASAGLLLGVMALVLSRRRRETAV
jgi:MYXO-CTERM domain-containing protein